MFNGYKFLRGPIHFVVGVGASAALLSFTWGILYLLGWTVMHATLALHGNPAMWDIGLGTHPIVVALGFLIGVICLASIILFVGQTMIAVGTFVLGLTPRKTLK